MSAQSTPKTKAVDLLHRAQILPRPQYDRAVALLHATNDRAEDVLIDNDILSEADLLKALSGIYRTHFVSAEKLSKADIPRATVQMIPRRVAETLGVFPVLFDRQTSVLSVVTPDPDNAEMLREVKLVSGARDVKAFVARPAAVSAAIRKHHAGDVRAFERFERAASYDFGQQVLADGRVMGARETFKRNSSTIDDEVAFDRVSPPPVQRRSSPDDDGEPSRGRPSTSNVRANSPDLDMPVPPPLPTKRASVKRATADVSLSAPPPPPASASARREAPPPEAARPPSSPFDLPPPQEPSSLTTRMGAAPPAL
ncbi:MAG: hypothetical protein KIS78_36340, partial [Labilithrix sp.]|nr:hypothetical protein [Labilithrix sp.]